MEYGLPCQQHKKALDCTNRTDCATCGFNPQEEAFRAAYLRKYGLTQHENGNKSLVITKERRKALTKELGC